MIIIHRHHLYHPTRSVIVSLISTVLMWNSVSVLFVGESLCRIDVREDVEPFLLCVGKEKPIQKHSTWASTAPG